MLIHSSQEDPESHRPSPTLFYTHPSFSLWKDPDAFNNRDFLARTENDPIFHLWLDYETWKILKNTIGGVNAGFKHAYPLDLPDPNGSIWRMKWLSVMLYPLMVRHRVKIHSFQEIHARYPTWSGCFWEEKEEYFHLMIRLRDPRCVTTFYPLSRVLHVITHEIAHSFFLNQVDEQHHGYPHHQDFWIKNMELDRCFFELYPNSRHEFHRHYSERRKEWAKGEVDWPFPKPPGCSHQLQPDSSCLQCYPALQSTPQTGREADNIDHADSSTQGSFVFESTSECEKGMMGCCFEDVQMKQG